jgi:hypothetical protein
MVRACGRQRGPGIRHSGLSIGPACGVAAIRTSIFGRCNGEHSQPPDIGVSGIQRSGRPICPGCTPGAGTWGGLGALRARRCVLAARRRRVGKRPTCRASAISGTIPGNHA